MSRQFKNGAGRWNEADDTEAPFRPIRVDGWYVAENVDDEYPHMSHPSGYVLTMALDPQEGWRGNEYAQVILTRDELSDILAEVGRREAEADEDGA